jgi:hypothetical protein
MRARDIEFWALNIIERVELKQRNEDTLVELKSEWIPPSKAARQIAGHANAARGEPILWLIGVDEKQGVRGADLQELADWWKQVEVEFDGVAPTMRDINVPWKGHTVAALLFETERAPFVVRNPAHGKSGGGSVQREVPWREGTSTRSATRSDLMLLLSPLQRVPRCELLEGSLTLYSGNYHGDDRAYHTWRLYLTLYMYPKNDAQTVIPTHLCKASFEVAGHIEETYFHAVDFPVYGTSTIGGIGGTNGSGGIIDGPGVLYVQAHADLIPAEINKPGNARIKVDLRPTDADIPIVIDESFHLASPRGGELFRWTRKNYSTGERGVAIKVK